MHFRFRGNNIQVVKSQPDGVSGKAKSVPLGSINRATLAISDKLSANCSEGELEKIREWVRRYRAVDNLKRRYAALTLPEQMTTAMRWFEENGAGEEARQAADEILRSTTALRRVLGKRGLL